MKEQEKTELQQDKTQQGEHTVSSLSGVQDHSRHGWTQLSRSDAQSICTVSWLYVVPASLPDGCPACLASVTYWILQLGFTGTAPHSGLGAIF